MEFLKDVLGEDLYEQVANKLKGNDKIKLVNLSNGEYVSKEKYNAMELQAKEREKQLSDINVQLETLKKTNADNGALQTQLTEWQTKYETDTKNLNELLTRKDFEYALDNALVGAKARNTKAVKALLETDKISCKDGILTGFDEQIKAVKEANGYLFEEEVTGGMGGLGNSGIDGTQGQVFNFSGIPDVITKN